MNTLSPRISMRNHLYFTAICFLSLAGCSSSSSTTGNSDGIDSVYPEFIAGNWFICEFSDATDCSILDDDGVTLTPDGRILRIEESSQGVLEQCGASPCFSSSVASIQVTQEPIGTYSYTDGQLAVSINNCNESSMLIISNAEVFIQISNCDADIDGSSTANGSLLREFTGTVEIVSSTN